MLSCFHSDPSLQKKKTKKKNRKAQVLKFDHFHMIYTIFLFPILTFVIQELKKKKNLTACFLLKVHWIRGSQNWFVCLNHTEACEIQIPGQSSRPTNQTLRAQESVLLISSTSDPHSLYQCSICELLHWTVTTKTGTLPPNKVCTVLKVSL